MPKRVTIPCDNVVNEKRINDGDPITIKEFRKRIADKGLNVRGKLILNFEARKGVVIVEEHDYHTLWRKGMHTFNINPVLSKENQSNRNLRKAHEKREGRPGIGERIPKRPTRRFFDMLLH